MADSESNLVDRRTFLAGLGGSTLALSGCAVARPAAAATGSATSAARAATGLRNPLASTAGTTLAQAIKGHVFTKGATGYTAAAHVYNERFDGILPEAVARPIDGVDVRNAVRWAVAGGVQVRARSGGHSYAGYSTLANGVVLDLRLLNGISVNKSARTATVGAGAQLIDVYAGLAAHGATLPAGSCPSVGVSGVTLGGGMGLAGRAFGLTTDNLQAVTIATADGRLRTVTAKTDPDLLWALRGGGGGNFGIVTEFTFGIHPLPSSAAYFFVSWPWAQAAEALSTWLAWAPHADERLTSIFHLSAGGGQTSVSVSGQFLGPASSLPTLLAPLKAVPGTSVSAGNKAYLPLQLLFAGCESRSQAACHTVGAAAGGTLPRESFDAKSDYLAKALPSAALNVLTHATEVRAGAAGSGAILFDSYGGKINQVAPSATAFVHRDMLCAMQYLSYNGDDGWLGQTWQQMRPYVSGQAYQNYIDSGLPNWQQAYYGSNYKRLQSIRKTVDPHHFFRFPQAID